MYFEIMIIIVDIVLNIYSYDSYKIFFIDFNEFLYRVLKVLLREVII